MIVLFSILLLTIFLVAAGSPPPECADISVVYSFDAPETPHGLTFDFENIYVTRRDFNDLDGDATSNIYKLESGGTFSEAFKVFGRATGLAYKDGNFWVATEIVTTISE